MRKWVWSLVLSLLVVISAHAANVEIKLAWDPNSESDLDGYRVYSRLEGQSYSFGPASAYLEDDVFVLPAPTATVVVAMEPLVWRYFVVTAYDLAGNESGPSNEVRAAIDRNGSVITDGDTIPPSPPRNLRKSMITILSQLFRDALSKLFLGVTDRNLVVQPRNG